MGSYLVRILHRNCRRTASPQWRRCVWWKQLDAARHRRAICIRRGRLISSDDGRLPRGCHGLMRLPPLLLLLLLLPPPLVVTRRVAAARFVSLWRSPPIRGDARGTAVTMHSRYAAPWPPPPPPLSVCLSAKSPKINFRIRPAVTHLIYSYTRPPRKWQCTHRESCGKDVPCPMKTPTFYSKKKFIWWITDPFKIISLHKIPRKKMRRRSEIRMDIGCWCGKSEVLFFQVNYFLTSVNRHFQNFVVHST